MLNKHEVIDHDCSVCNITNLLWNSSIHSVQTWTQSVHTYCPSLTDVSHSCTTSEDSLHFLWVQAYGCLWMHLCFLKHDGRLNLLSHLVHAYGRTFVWIRLCSLKHDGRLNRLSHSVHAYGRSFAWMNIWILKVEDSLNRLSHSVHAYFVHLCEWADGYLSEKIG